MERKHIFYSWSLSFYICTINKHKTGRRLVNWSTQQAPYYTGNGFWPGADGGQEEGRGLSQRFAVLVVIIAVGENNNSGERRSRRRRKKEKRMKSIPLLLLGCGGVGRQLLQHILHSRSLHASSVFLTYILCYLSISSFSPFHVFSLLTNSSCRIVLFVSCFILGRAGVGTPCCGHIW